MYRKFGEIEEKIMHHINEKLDEIEGKKKIPCSSKCKYYCKAFEHRDKACILSDVFSVKIGEPCSTFEFTVVS